MAADADRHLLFGLLALQNGLIDQSKLVAAFHSWTQDKARPLADHLVARGDLDADQRAAVEAMAVLHLKTHGGDTEKSLAAVSAGRSTRDGLAMLGDPELTGMLAHLGSGTTEPGDDTYATNAVGRPNSDGRRFRVLRPYARGGLGAVFVARDEELNREVALKQILDGYADDPISRQRFLMEAEVTGGLEHPGIVPVYGLGIYPDGRPYYAMRLIKGDSLKAAIAQFHADEALRRDPGARALALQKLLRRFLDVCNAVDYAHSRGVLHRDLKPANVMVGPYGETLVVDWGLAKVVGSPSGSVEAALHPPSVGGSAETLPGSAVGTPAYMSPEQSAGRLDDLGPASDVYSLGATLYHLLTGRAPFVDRDVGAVLRGVQAGDFPPPRRVVLGVPRALEAVCLKAMAADPPARYGSAKELAGEVERWLADEPVSAYREPWSARAWRWVRRHRTGAIAAASAVLVGLVGLAAVAAVTAAKNRALDRANAALGTALGRETTERIAKEKALGQSEESRKAALRSLHAARMNLVQRVMEGGEAETALELLAAQEPGRTGGSDLRGFEWYYWKSRTPRNRRTIRGDGVIMTSIAFSPDGARLASSDGETLKPENPGKVRLWDTATGREVRSLAGHEQFVAQVVFSPDGRWLASAGWDGTVRVWDAATGREVRVLKGHRGRIDGVVFGPDGRHLASAGADGTVRVWDRETGREVRALAGHEGGVESVAFSPDGRALASAGSDGTVRVWDAGGGEQMQVLRGHTAGVHKIRCSPDGRWLATGSSDRTARIWDIRTGQELRCLRGHTDAVTGVAFSPDGARLATVGYDQRVKVWDLASGRETLSFKAHQIMDMWDVTFSPDGKTLATSNYDGTIRFWELPSPEEPVVFRGHEGEVRNVALHRDGKLAASASFDRIVRVWEVATGREVRALRGHADRVNGVAFSPDGSLVASAGFDRTARIWRLDTGEELRTLRGHGHTVYSVAFSPDGRRLATGSRDNTVKLWDASSGAEVATLRGHDREVNAVAFSPDGRWLASAGSDRSIVLWDPKTGRQIRRLAGHANLVMGVGFSPDSRNLASASWDTTVRIWEPATGAEVRMLSGHTAWVYGVSFSPDGERLISGSTDGTVKVWDPAIGHELMTLRGHAGGVSGVAFGPDGRRIVSSSLDRTVRVWDATPGRGDEPARRR
jgi:WD40 repeat protein/tRNA A-37 threonylcarbamoyl transferase component Bud32